jgi:hypothetical protein
MMREGYKMQNFYFLEQLAHERINEHRQLAGEIQRAVLAEQAERKRRQASASWFSFLFRLFSRGLVPDVRPLALRVRAEVRRDR